MYRIVLAFLAVVACQSAPQTDTTQASASTPPGASSSEVTLTLDRTSYSAGATAMMTIVSRSRDTLGFNQCSSRAIERQQGSNWVAHPEPDRMCTMELRLLMPNETQTASTDLPATLSAGTYRMVLTLGRQRTPREGETATAVRAVSGNFRVN